LLPGTSCFRSASSVRPCPWLRLHWGPSPPVGISNGSGLLDRHGACVTAVTSQHAGAYQVIKYNLTYCDLISFFLMSIEALLIKYKDDEYLFIYLFIYFVMEDKEKPCLC
jgi:hypothetical protein